ncbi:hypothetical protein IWW50_004433 [Coemansia erecta]|nr:hypothetical protein IWW50_004433 [Coemansia erecta]
MPAYSVAQLLPAHIIDSIVRHLPYSSPEPESVAKEPPLPLKSQSLIPLLGICRSWRPSACSEFYSKALIRLDGTYSHKHCDNRAVRIVRIDHALQNGHQRCVKDVLVLVDISNFNQDWDSDTPNLASIIRNCQQLPRARSITYYFVLDYHRNNYHHDNCQHVVPEPDKIRNRSTIAKNIGSFVAAVRETMPRISRVSAYNGHIGSIKPTIHQIINTMFDHLGKFIGSHPTHLSLENIDVPNALGTIPATASLQSISLLGYRSQEPETALIQRNANTLEQLWIRMATPSALIKLVRAADKPLEIRIFPRLKHFIVLWGHDERDPDSWQPAANPFPRLETLVCHGYFPFTSPAVLAECQTHLRHLDIDVDTALLTDLDQAGVFAEGAFTSLQYVSLKWARHGYGGSYNRNSLFYKSAHLCNSTRTLCLRSMELANVKTLVAKAQFPHTLRYLDMPFTMLKIDQAIAILSACPQVLKANLSLTDISDGSSKGMPAPGVLIKYQKEYSDCAARLKYLGVRSVSFRSTRRAAEFTVLLVDIIPSIVRVCISPEGCSGYDFLNHVDRARKRTVYDGHSQLDSVQFSVERCW